MNSPAALAAHELKRLAVLAFVFHLQQLALGAAPEVAVELAGELVVLGLDRPALGLDGLGAHEVAAHAVDLVADGREQLAGGKAVLAPPAVHGDRPAQLLFTAVHQSAVVAALAHYGELLLRAV